MRIFPCSVLIVATLAVALPHSAAGRDGDKRERMPETVQRVENETGGRVLHVRPIQRGDRQIYRMKVLTPEGRVRVMQDSPRQRMRESAPPTPQPAAAPRERDDG